MLGIRCSSGPTPVVIVAAQTGVTEGNAATQSSTYAPSCRIRASAGARPEAIARSSIAGLSASMTTRTSFLASLIPAPSLGREPAALTPASVLLAVNGICGGEHLAQDPETGVLLLVTATAAEQEP